MAYASCPGEMDTFAPKAATGASVSVGFREAPRVFGRANRDAADPYLVYELAEKESGDWKDIRNRIGFSEARIDQFRKSANHLSATEGRRHASGDPPKATMNLDEISRFATAVAAA